MRRLLCKSEVFIFSQNSIEGKSVVLWTHVVRNKVCDGSIRFGTTLGAE